MIRMLSIFLAGFMLFVTAAPVAASGTASPALAKYTEQVDGAVERGLVWLARNQRKNGSFPGQYGETTAVAGLAGLAFLSKGHTPMGKPYGTQINRCIDYILANQQASGYLNSGRSDGRIYAHSIATLFLTQGRLSWILPGWAILSIAALVIVSSILGSVRSSLRAGGMRPVEALSHKK